MTKKKLIVFNLVYYALCLIVYVVFLSAASVLLDLSGESASLGTVMAVTYVVLFLMTPVVVGVLMRFSLFRWYIDPIAAAEIPLFLYLVMIVNQYKHAGEWKAAILLVKNQLSDDGGEGWFFLIGLFVFGLIMSLSFARKKGQNVSYQLLSKFTNTITKGESEE